MSATTVTLSRPTACLIEACQALQGRTIEQGGGLERFELIMLFRTCHGDGRRSSPVRELDQGGADTARSAGDQHHIAFANAGPAQHVFRRGVGTGEGRELGIGQAVLIARTLR